METEKLPEPEPALAAGGDEAPSEDGPTHSEAPPACLAGRELEGAAGRRALSEQVQAILRNGHGSDPTPEEASSIQRQFSISADDVTAVFRYFREMRATFKENISEAVPPTRSVMRASAAPWSGGAESPGVVESAGVDQSESPPEQASWYEGEWSEDGSQPHGHGTYQWPDGTRLTGAWVNGQVHGAARIETPDGHWFEGEWADGKSTGSGELRRKLPDGSIYTGCVADFVASGQGTCIRPDGQQYVGNWIDGLPHGQGKETMSAAKGSGWYDGEWQSGKRTGHGEWRRPASGDGYENVFETLTGEFRDGVPVGACTVVCDDGSIMDIFYDDQTFSGEAKIGRDPHNGGSRQVKVTWPSTNASWVGWFDAGIFDSKDASKQLKATGTLTLAVGTFEGDFRHRLGNGVIKGSAVPGSVRYLVPLEGKHVWPDGVTYEGTFNADGLREGAGKTTLPNGVVHSGMYKAGWVDFSAKCSLNVPDGAGEESNSLDEGEHIGVLNKDLTFVLAKSRFGRSSAIDVVPLLGADSLLTSQR